MSKIERLNARVAKLLTAAVHEVLEVVRETVSEYQEKTARTQRENESLRRRLRELQDKVKRVGTRTTQHLSLPASGERVLIDQQQHCNQEWSSNLRQGTEFPPTEDTQELPEQHNMKQRNEECNRLELTHLESETECDILVPELNAISTDCVTQITDAGLSVFVPHPVINNSNLDTLCPETSSFCMLPNLGSDEIKTEPEPLEYTISEQQTTKNNFYNCTDSSSNIAQTEVTEEPHEFNTGSHAMVYIHPDHSNFEERFSFQKTSRSILDAQKQKQYHRHEEQHRCLLCGKTFSRVGNLRIHQRCHTGEKPYCCIQCGRCFSHAGNLKKHKRVHTGERPYSCHQCGKTFSQSSHLKKHLKIHVIRHLSVS